MQGENETDAGGGYSGASPDRRCTSSADGLPGCSTVLIDSPVKSTATCRSAPPALGARSSDGKTRRYVRSSEPRLKWTEELHQCFIRATAKLGGPEKATPKAILQEMNVRWLKIAHVKSHLQMYRNPKSGKILSPGQSDDFTFWRVAQPAEETAEVWNSHAMDNVYQPISHGSTGSQIHLAAGNRQYMEHDADVDASWSSLTRGSATPQYPNMTTSSVDISAARDQQYVSTADHFSDHFSVCPLEQQPAQLTLAAQFSNGQSHSSDPIADESTRVGADFLKMTEVLMGNRTTKSRDFESPDDVDDRRRFLSDQILAGDADASRLYDSAEALAHNLLMAMRERKLLEAGISHDIIAPEMPLDLTMSVGVPESNPDVRSEILTLDLTEQLNRPHL